MAEKDKCIVVGPDGTINLAVAFVSVLSKDIVRATLADEALKFGPQVSLIGKP